MSRGNPAASIPRIWSRSPHWGVRIAGADALSVPRLRLRSSSRTQVSSGRVTRSDHSARGSAATLPSR